MHPRFDLLDYRPRAVAPSRHVTRLSFGAPARCPAPDSARGNAMLAAIAQFQHFSSCARNAVWTGLAPLKRALETWRGEGRASQDTKRAIK
eukprot:968358-Pyramimonas_sp.AAC.1